jgi:hypothetical protein
MDLPRLVRPAPPAIAALGVHQTAHDKAHAAALRAIAPRIPANHCPAWLEHEIIINLAFGFVKRNRLIGGAFLACLRSSLPPPQLAGADARPLAFP